MTRKYTPFHTLQIDVHLLRTIRYQGSNVKPKDGFEEIVLSCFRSALDTFDNESFRFEATEENRLLIEDYIKRLKEMKLRAHMEEGEEEDEYILYVTWF